MTYKKLPMETALERHTNEIKEMVSYAIELFELIIGELSEREKKIFEIAYCNGYSDSNDANSRGEQIKVLK